MSKVPCICSECRKNPTPAFFDYKKQLLHKLKKGKKAVKECDRSCEEVDIFKLIDHAFYEYPPAVKAILAEKKHFHIYGDYVVNQEKNVIKDSTFRGSSAGLGDITRKE